MRVNRFSSRKSKSRNLKVILIFLVPILLASLYIWQRVTVITLSTQNKELRLQIKRHQKTIDYMQIEVTKLSSIDRIEKMVEPMGFIRPPLDSIRWIQELPDTIYIKKPSAKENIWAKLKTLKKNIFSVDKAYAKEIKHDH